VKSTDRVSFTNLHKACETPVKMPKHCPACDVDVEADDLVSGYRVAKDTFLVISDEEKASVAANRSPVISISKFVSARSTPLMDAVRLETDKSYWLPPQSDHVLRPYAVLANGMAEESVLGLAQATVWSRQWPVVIEAFDGLLALTQIHPASSVRAGGLDHPKLTTSERSMARAVIAEFTGELNPSDLVSDADDALKDLVQAKLAGTEFTAPEIVAPEPTIDMMDTLKTMIADAKKAKTKAKAKPKAKA